MADAHDAAVEQPLKKEKNTGRSGGTPCLILDDEELEQPRSFRIWREDTEQLAAARIFGGHAVATKPKGFPAAFQTYRPAGAGGAASSPPSPFPFQMRPRTARPPATAPTLEGGATSRPGALTASVVETFQPATPPYTSQTISTILSEGLQLLALEPLQLSTATTVAAVPQPFYGGDYGNPPRTPPWAGIVPAVEKE